MFTAGINFTNFKIKAKTSSVKKKLFLLIKEKNEKETEAYLKKLKGKK